MTAQIWRTVTTITVEENAVDHVFTLGIAEDSLGESSYLILQTSVDEPTAQDAATGMDSYCVMDDEGGVYYGGIQHVELRENELIMRFIEEASEELSVLDAELQLQLEVSETDLAQLRGALRRILTYGNPDQHPTLAGL